MPWKGQTIEQHRAAVARTQQRKLRFLRALKEACGCVDCGIADYRLLQFDHVDIARKTRNNRRRTNFLRLGWHKLVSELEHCEVVCANCHTIRTHERRAAI